MKNEHILPHLKAEPEPNLDNSEDNASIKHR